MKIALCLSGQPRYLDQGYESLHKNFLSVYDIDVFSHIWFDNTLAGSDINLCIQYNRKLKWETNADVKVLGLYKPKKYIFEPPRTFNLEPFKGANFELLASDPNRVLSMFYSIKQANYLKCLYEQEHGFRYDLVIRARTDLVVENNLLLPDLNIDKIYCYGTNCFEDSKEICNDQLAIGSSNNIDTYSSLFDKLEHYWLVDKPKSMVGERILFHHLLKTNLNYYCCKRHELYVNIIKDN